MLKSVGSVVIAITAACAFGQEGTILGGNLIPNELVEMSRTSGATTSRVAVGESPQGLAYNSNTGEVYAVDAGDNSVFSINPDTGATTLLAAVTGASNANGLAYDPVNDIIYVSDNNNNRVYSVDPSTGAPSTIGVISGANGVEGLAYDPINGILYGLSDLTDRIVTIDPDTEQASPLSLALPAVNWRGLAYDVNENALYASVSVSGNFYRIDLFPLRLVNLGGISPARAVQGLAIIQTVEICQADLDGDGTLSIFDFIEFQNLFADSDPRADINGDGLFNLFDFLEFQNLFDQGCD